MADVTPTTPAPAIDNDAAQTIMYDVMVGRPEADSRLTYTAPMRKFRAVVEAEWSEWHKENPDHQLAVPNELPRTDIKVPVIAATKESTTLTDEDRALLEAGKGDHFYGSWKSGGGGGGGGEPAGLEGVEHTNGITKLDDVSGFEQMTMTAANAPMSGDRVEMVVRDGAPTKPGLAGKLRGEKPKQPGRTVRGIVGDGPLQSDWRGNESFDKNGSMWMVGSTKAYSVKDIIAFKVTNRAETKDGKPLPISKAIRDQAEKDMKESYALSEADRIALAAAGHPVPLLEKGKDDHPYGAWKGGKASAGGGPAGAAAGNKGPMLDDKKAALEHLGPAGEMKDGVLHIAGKPATPEQVESLNKTIATMKSAAADQASGAAQGDAFRKGLDASPKPSSFFGKKPSEFPTLAQARAAGRPKGFGTPGFALYPAEKAQLKALGLKQDSVTGRIYRPGGSAPAAPKMSKGGFADRPIKSMSTAKSKGGPGFDRTSRWNNEKWTPTGRTKRSKWDLMGGGDN